MQDTSTGPAPLLQFRQDIEAQFRRHIREAALEVSLTEELAQPSGRAGTSGRTPDAAIATAQWSGP
jgi:hypothetical protein